MKKIKILCLALTCLFAFACVKSDEPLSLEKLEAIRTANTGGETARLLKEDAVIDIDIEKLNKELSDRTKPKYQKPELAKARAVLYRYYSHVKLNGDQYVSTLKSAGEINVSEKFFKYLNDGLNKTNQEIKRMKAKDPNLEIPQITPQYLQSLTK
jgi:hypothetical protein